jgi:mono/diheme cytochrome c family protein
VIGQVPTEEDTGTGGGGGEAEGDAAAGKAVFASAGCGSCHTLSDAGSSGTVGPNLDDSSIDFAGAVEQITNGGGGMQAFSGTLSEEEIANVAAYVVTARG